MKIIKEILLLFFVSVAVAGCRQPNEELEEKAFFPYRMSVTAPAEYPVEVHMGYFSNAKGFITAIPKAGIEGNGWTRNGSNGGIGATNL